MNRRKQLKRQAGENRHALFPCACFISSGSSHHLSAGRILPAKSRIHKIFLLSANSLSSCVWMGAKMNDHTVSEKTVCETEQSETWRVTIQIKRLLGRPTPTTPPSQAPTPAEAAVFGFSDLLKDEREWIRIRAEKRRIRNVQKQADADGAQQSSVNAAEIGLAISGGGVRSATYGLGVLQGMARIGCGEESLLGQLGYLSSVSGGSYLNSWFSTWISRAGFQAVQKALAERIAKSPYHVAETQAERYQAQRPISHLRQYSSYLSPKTGPFSSDTWTAIAGYLMRLFPNLAFVVSACIAAVIAPYLLRDAVGFAIGESRSFPMAAVAVAMSFFVGMLMIAWRLDSLDLSDAAKSRNEASKGALTMFVSCLLITPLIASLAEKTTILFFTRDLGSVGRIVEWVPFPFTTQSVSTGAIFLLISCSFLVVLANFLFSRKAPRDRPVKRKFLNGVKSTMAGLLSLLAVLLLFGWAKAAIPEHWENIVACVLPALLMLVYLAMSSVYLYVLRFDDESQEWLSRMWGGAASLSVVWLLAGGLVLLLPLWVNPIIEFLVKTVSAGKTTDGWAHQLTGWSAIAVWLGTTIASVMSAFSGKTGGPTPAETTAVPVRMRKKQEADRNRAISLLALAAPYFVVIGGLVVLAFVGMKISHWIQRVVVNPNTVGWSLPLVQLLGFLFAVCVAWYLSRTMDVNRLSLHNVYRFRLAECYLDALDGVGLPERANQQSLEATLTPLADLAAEHNDGPYSIINAALNVTKKGELTLQQRKAVNFIFTPKYCGFHYAKRDQVGMLEKDAYRKSEQYLSIRQKLTSLDKNHDDARTGGDNKISRSRLLLSEAMAISGAAQSPNQGNHTSPAVAVLLSMANIRLGAWVGNPRHKQGWEKFPSVQGGSLLWDELLTHANDEKEFVYLSDGGHFENLGLYELVRRRCRIVFCSDADCDPAYEFRDLLNAMERCTVDFNATIKIDTSRLRRFGRSGYSRMSFAVGTITYTDGGQPGVLVLFKPAITRSSSTVVQEYDSSNSAFPHEPTANQWFDEEQFEAYRLIGLEAAIAFGDALKTVDVPAGCDPEAWHILRRELL
jgi:hypothetical protein